MIRKMQKYPDYRSSDDTWLGEIPGHWRSTSLGSISTRKSNRNRPDLPLLSVLREKGVVLRSSLSQDENHNFIPDDLTNYQVANEGDLVVNKMKAWQGSVGIAPQDGIVSPAYYVFELADIKKNYAHRLLRSRLYADFFGRASDGVRIGQWDLGIPAMKRIPVLIPPPDEQDSIVRYLDEKDRRIARFIHNRQRLIEVLNEQKQAIINRAVTRGLDPNAPLKPSGIDLLGDIPAHWKVVPLRWYMRTESGDFLDGRYIVTVRSSTHPIPVIGGNGVMGYTSLANCSDPAIVIGRVGALCGNVHLIEGSAWITDNALRISRIRCFSIGYLSLLLRTINLNRLANANAQPLITGSMIKSQVVVLPPEKDQQLIVKRIAKATRDLNEAIIKAQNEINLIREYRTRLISDVVTGKIDVRHLAPPQGSEELEDLAEALEPLEEDITENMIDDDEEAACESN